MAMTFLDVTSMTVPQNPTVDQILPPHLAMASLDMTSKGTTPTATPNPATLLANERVLPSWKAFDLGSNLQHGNDIHKVDFIDTTNTERKTDHVG